jgi:hypothetical protein
LNLFGAALRFLSGFSELKIFEVFEVFALIEAIKVVISVAAAFLMSFVYKEGINFLHVSDLN